MLTQMDHQWWFNKMEEVDKVELEHMVHGSGATGHDFSGGSGGGGSGLDSWLSTTIFTEVVEQVEQRHVMLDKVEMVDCWTHSISFYT